MGFYAIVTPLMRKLLAALAAVVILGSVAEAAPAKKTVRHRPRHSSRVTAGTGAPALAAETKKTTPTRKKKAGAAAAKTKTTTAAKKRTPSTKPR